ncbi:uncharacterized protein BX664DRAFT_342467 [Halteromyces radiatus]|uniref:uncharacterized protein n=1 Tax=Halteromyces radiatus TaxID=101107 RepID=UPI00221F3F38|nr:uncharacterized protein BX664DRAFT_342467 [Halteromyces radiatus]KAI8078675.1 hypothetical protein BX664DRAFT_342467 [Halteromyces radiatus]
MMTSFVPLDETVSRKRKQEPTSLSEFVYSSPNSPSPHPMNLSSTDIMDHGYSFGFDPSSFEYPSLNDYSDSHSRRHSVAVGDMDYYHQYNNNNEFIKQEPLDHMNWGNVQQLFGGTSLPSSFSSHSSGTTSDDTATHQRTLSLRLENLPSSPQDHATPTTPVFFSPTFLDSLSATTEEDSFTNFMDSSFISSQQHTIPSDFLVHPAAERRAKNSLVSARIVQGANSATQLKPLIQRYLLSNDSCGEHSVTILTSKVAQKSYGTEKRFLCPPPTTILSGASWWTQKDGTLSTPKLTIHISGEPTSQNGTLEWSDQNGCVMENPSSLAQDKVSLSGKCVSKQLHINDADEKRRRVEVLVKIQLGNGLQLGTLASKGIKVISKPSKKRQSLKNMELCIHHGTTVSLFNRIRSQTVSTKYLGVSNGDGNNTGTCFVARTGSWDPFVIWIVDTSRSPESASSTPPRLPHHPTNPDFPPPPAIALQSGASLQTPMALHYNQPVVLQCVSTGLVSPVMVIRKVDKGSAVLGGNRVEDLSGLTGGECGDEAIGDPVSQLHKIAFQIVQDPSVAYNNKANYQLYPNNNNNNRMMNDWILPQASHPVTYLACLNDVVGMHKTSTMRTVISARPPPSSSSWNMDDDLISSMISSQIEGKVVRKRRVSCDVVKNNKLIGKNIASQRRRVNSLNDVMERADRRSSISSDDGSCWTEDVSDAAVWTIVGTDSAKFTFWTPQQESFNNPFTHPQQSHAITPFPLIHHINSTSSNIMVMTGENLTRDLAVWFGDVKAPLTEYKSRDLISCTIPDVADLRSSLVASSCNDDPLSNKIPILLVRGDGVVYRTGEFYSF